MAAIRHVLSGTYKALIAQYAAAEYKPELAAAKATLDKMAEAYNAAVDKVVAVADQQYTDFMARRLVEMAGFTVMGYLLLQDTERNETFARTMGVYIKLAEAEVTKHSEFISTFDKDQLALYNVEA